MNKTMYAFHSNELGQQNFVISTNFGSVNSHIFFAPKQFGCVHKKLLIWKCGKLYLQFVSILIRKEELKQISITAMNRTFVGHHFFVSKQDAQIRVQPQKSISRRLKSSIYKLNSSVGERYFYVLHFTNVKFLRTSAQKWLLEKWRFHSF